MNFEKIYSEFIFWLKGLIEDDPIPFEIKSLVFFVNKNYEIGFSGSEEENIKVVEYYFYFPLEAEYFYCKDLYKYIYSKKDREKTSLEILKKLLCRLKNDINFRKFNYFYGRLYDVAEKLEK